MYECAHVHVNERGREGERKRGGERVREREIERETPIERESRGEQAFVPTEPLISQAN